MKEHKRRRFVYTLVVPAILIASCLLFTGCGDPIDSATDKPATIDMVPDEKDTTHPDLSSQLFQLVQAYENGAVDEYAETNNIYIADGKVFVTVFVSQDETDAAKKEIRTAGGEIKGSFGREIDALVPIDKLCELSDKDSIASIQLPSSDTAT